MVLPNFRAKGEQSSFIITPVSTDPDPVIFMSCRIIPAGVIPVENFDCGSLRYQTCTVYIALKLIFRLHTSKQDHPDLDQPPPLKIFMFFNVFVYS